MINSKRKTLLVFSLLFLFSIALTAQNATLSGIVKDAYSNEVIPFTNIIIYKTNIGATSNEEGKFKFENLQPGFVQLQLSSIGYEPLITEQIAVSAVRNNYIEVALTPSNTQLEEVQIRANPFAHKIESPLSLQRIGVDIIEKSAGASRDFSKVLQSFPGVASTSSFRNDLIVRGGGPSENRFYLDGIEIPVLNHFSTQGASGGPVGIINVDFIREVDFYSGAFPASRGNALSSVFEFRQLDPNPEKTSFKATLGASEVAASVNTPITEKTSALFSVRRSYLQLLFNTIGLPFLPTFNDFQFFTKTKLSARNEITFLGLGAIDQFNLNFNAPDTEENQYILSYLPVTEQWNYTIGSAYKHFFASSYFVLSASRNHLNNINYKYKENDDSSEANLLYDYISDEIENKMRFEYFANPGTISLNTGFNVETAHYYNRTSNTLFVNNAITKIDYLSKLNMIKWGAFISFSKSLFNNKLNLSAGARVDANNYNSNMQNPLNQFSPRASASVVLLPKLTFNTSAGRFFQLPAYTTLGYKDENDQFVNRENNLKYISADHLVAGLEWLPNGFTKISVEGFHKNYANYPVSVNDGISLASKGADYGVLGDEEVLSKSKGKAYGAELLLQQSSSKGLSYILAYTLVKSEFTDLSEKTIASSWDSGHLLTLTVNKSFKKNWDAGLKWRFVGGLPYTPIDEATSRNKEAWDAQRREYIDYSKYNTLRFDPFHQLDLRVDKSYYFKKFSLEVYLDIQNAYNFKSKNAPKLIQELDENGNPKTSPDNNNDYLLKKIITSSGTVLPSIGIILEF